MQLGAVTWFHFKELSSLLGEMFPFVLEKTSLLVMLTFLMTRTRWLPDLGKPRLSLRDQIVAAALFLSLGFAEVAISLQRGSDDPLAMIQNLRIVAVVAAGLLAGPWVGGFMGIAITFLATLAPNSPGQPAPIAISMVVGGLAAGFLHDWKPGLMARPLAGFLMGASISCLRDILNLILDPSKPTTYAMIAGAVLLQGLSVALILAVIEQTLAQQTQAKAAALAEVRALQARMDPHFLFNSLNTLSALSQTDPSAVPEATAHLGKFLRASIDQHDQLHISLREELEIVDAYLEIEKLRFADRITIRRDIDPEVLDAQLPPFLLQPLVENAIQHGLQPKAAGGTVHIGARRSDGRLFLSVADDGVGMSDKSQQASINSQSGHLHALAILRLRLEGLYRSNHQTSLRSQLGRGTEVQIQIPYLDARPEGESFIQTPRTVGAETAAQGSQ